MKISEELRRWVFALGLAPIACSSLAQIVGQCGSSKLSIQTPLEGLYIVGCDAGGTGSGTQQAIMSGFNVADAVEQKNLVR